MPIRVATRRSSFRSELNSTGPSTITKLNGGAWSSTHRHAYRSRRSAVPLTEVAVVVNTTSSPSRTNHGPSFAHDHRPGQDSGCDRRDRGKRGPEVRPSGLGVVANKFGDADEAKSAGDQEREGRKEHDAHAALTAKIR